MKDNCSSLSERKDCVCPSFLFIFSWTKSCPFSGNWQSSQSWSKRYLPCQLKKVSYSFKPVRHKVGILKLNLRHIASFKVRYDHLLCTWYWWRKHIKNSIETVEINNWHTDRKNTTRLSYFRSQHSSKACQRFCRLPTKHRRHLLCLKARQDGGLALKYSSERIH